MTTLTWTHAVSTDAADPQNWSPAQLPAPGDSLEMPVASTIDIVGDVLAGDTLHIGSDTPAVFPPPVAELNVSGRAHFDFENNFPPRGVASTNVELAGNSQWIGGFASTFAPVFIHGGEWRNTTTTINGARVVADTQIAGHGHIRVGTAQSSTGFLEVTDSVSAGQSITVQGDPERFRASVLQIDKPDEFKAAVDLGRGEVVLEGLTADSFTFQGHELRLFEAGHEVEKLRLSLIEGATGFGVSQISGGIDIHADGEQPGVSLALRC